MIDYTLKSADGQGGVVTTDYIAQSMREAGENVVGISPDGGMLTLQDAQGTFNVKTSDALKQMGWTVQGATPQNADFSGVSAGMRAAVNKLPTDDARRMYIEQTLTRQGIEKPQIMGAGRDWYAFNPQSGRYTALTNTPNWDVSDAVEFGLEVPRAIASAVGGGAGLALGGGVASVPLGMAGAGLAGGAVDALTRGAIAGVDPAFRDVARANLGDMGKDLAMGAGLDAATMGLYKGAGPAGRWVGGKLMGGAQKIASPKIAGAMNFAGKAATGLGNATEAVMQAAPASKTAQAVGRVSQGMGEGMQGLAKMADNSLGHELATFGIPGAAEMQAASFIGQAPSYLSRGMVRGLDWLGNRESLRQIAPKLAGNLKGAAKRLGEEGLTYPTWAQKVQGSAEDFARRVGGNPAQVAEETLRPSDIWANAFREARIRGGEAVQKFKGRVRGPTDLGGYKEARAFGFDPAASRDLADDTLHKFLAEETDAAANWAGAGRKFGQGMERLEKFSKGVGDVATQAGKAVVKSTGALGTGLHTGGTLLRAGATRTAPLEMRNAARYGSEELWGPEMESLYSRRRRSPSRTMNAVLANN